MAVSSQSEVIIKTFIVVHEVSALVSVIFSWCGGAGGGPDDTMTRWQSLLTQKNVDAKENSIWYHNFDIEFLKHCRIDGFGARETSSSPDTRALVS